MSESPSSILLDTSPRAPTAPYPWPPQSEDRRSRAPEFYGFVAWTSTYLLFVLYILWAVLPDEWIVWCGVTWYPNRYVTVFQVQRKCIHQPSFLACHREWALLIPSWTVVLVLLTYFTYFALAIRATPAFEDMSSVTGTPVFIYQKTWTDFGNRFAYLSPVTSIWELQSLSCEC